MADKIFHSTAVTFVDMTDSRILDVYISSNHPTIQICNVNQTPLEYTPDWSTTNLKLEASFYLDSSEITPEMIEWYTKIGTTETTVGHEATLYVTNNVLENNAIITYGCRVTYQNLEAFKEITFTRVDTGLNGMNGTSAPAVQAQYSADGSTGWTVALNAATHKYIRYSYDGGKTWTTAIKMVGEDGSSVNIKGTATSKSSVSGTSYYTLVYNSATITGADIGDAYLLDGDLYVCVDSRDGNDYFMDVGHVQGPQGNDGASSYVFIRYATDASGSNMTANPNNTTTHIGICTVNTNSAPTTASSYTWSKFVGDNAKSIILSGNSQVFKFGTSSTAPSPGAITVSAKRINIPATTTLTWYYNDSTTAPTGVTRNGDSVVITGSNLTTNSLTIRATDGSVEDVFTVYKAFDGADGNPGAPGDPASMAFLTNENVSFSANASGVITAMPITTNVVAYRGITKQMPTIDVNTISGAPSGMTITTRQDTLLNEVELTISFTAGTNLGSSASTSGTITIPVTSPVVTNLKLSWSKINSGATGVGIKSTTVSYGMSDDSSTQPTEWQSTIPTVAEGKYLWTRTIIDYTDDNVPDTVTYIYAKQGTKGDEGKGGTSVTVSSIQYQEGSSATTAPTGTWSNAVVAAADGKYLWTKTVFSDGKTAYGVAKQGAQGTAGRGVSSIVEQYYQSTSATSQTNGSWSTTVPTWVDGKYIWTRSVITYTDTTTYTTSPICVTGQKGGTGGIGLTGVGVSSVDIWYYQSTSATALTGGSWSTTAPIWSDGKYVWTKTITTYTNNTTDETSAVCLTGQKGSTGVGIKAVTEHYLATSSSSGVTASTTGWTEAIQTITATNKYLWNYETITYTNDTTTTTAPIIIGVFGSTGATGKGIKSVTENYLATNSSSGVTTSTSGWTTTMQALTATKKYLWNYELITYTDNSTATINPVIIGVYGDKGDQGAPAISVMLSSEAHVFEADSQGVPVPTSITFDIIGYQGLTQSSTTVGTITGLPSAGMTATILNNSTTNTQIQIAVTESLTSVDSGVLTIPVTVNDKVVNKKFSWTKSKEGLMGQRGADAISFQVYSENGYVLSKDTPSITLQTFAYNGDVPIEAGAIYQWYKYDSGNWVAITDATNGYLKISHSDVSFSGSYMCKMLFNNIEYVGVATIDDKNDTNIVFTSKPTSYAAGDIWIVGSDYAPSGVITGTVLKAEYPNNTYTDKDWIIATKYDKALEDINKHIHTYNQYFDFDDEEGLRITAKDKNNVESKFSTTLTNEQLAFNYGNEAIAYINGTSMHIKEAEIESPLTITGKYEGSTMKQPPTFNIGNFSIVVESNGSLSIVSNI